MCISAISEKHGSRTAINKTPSYYISGRNSACFIPSPLQARQASRNELKQLGLLGRKCKVKRPQHSSEWSPGNHSLDGATTVAQKRPLPEQQDGTDSFELYQNTFEKQHIHYPVQVRKFKIKYLELVRGRKWAWGEIKQYFLITPSWLIK